MQKIWLQNAQNKFPFSLRARLTICRAVRATIRAMGDKNREVSVLITDNENIRTLNNTHRQIDCETDVLSFPMGDGEKLLGDIVISLEKAYAQAEEYGHSASRELGFLTVHSMLHLYGYDHIEESDRLKMRGLEEKILSGIGLIRNLEK